MVSDLLKETLAPFSELAGLKLNTEVSPNLVCALFLASEKMSSLVAGGC